MKHRHRSIAIVAALSAGLLILLGLVAPATARAASPAPATPRAGVIDSPTQTTGSAVLYGTTTPVSVSVSKGAAAAATRAPASLQGPRAAHFLHRAVARTGQALTPPSPRSTPLVADPGAATGFAGLTFGDSTLAGTGQ